MNQYDPRFKQGIPDSLDEELLRREGNPTQHAELENPQKCEVENVGSLLYAVEGVLVTRPFEQRGLEEGDKDQGKEARGAIDQKHLAGHEIPP